MSRPQSRHDPRRLPENGANGDRPRFGAKSEFVRSLDRSIPAAEVVGLAAARGMKMSAGFVYNIRSLANGKLRAHAGPKLKPPSTSRHEEVLRVAIAQLGIQRARQILDEVEATFVGGRS